MNFCVDFVDEHIELRLYDGMAEGLGHYLQLGIDKVHENGVSTDMSEFQSLSDELTELGVGKDG